MENNRIRKMNVSLKNVIKTTFNQQTFFVSWILKAKKMQDKYFIYFDSVH